VASTNHCRTVLGSTSDAQVFGQARHHAHDELDGDALAMEERAEGLQKVAATGDAQQLPPGTATGMAIGADIAPSDPSPIGTVWVRAEMGGGVYLAAAPPRGYDAWGPGCMVPLGGGRWRAYRRRSAALW
jgi:hypothetical protein